MSDTGKLSKMNPEIKQKWVVALRSGRFVQGKTYLKRVTKISTQEFAHCCLGVLCDVMGLKEGLSDESGIIAFDGRRSILTNDILKMAGLSGRGGYVEVGVTTLSGMNDIGKNFIEIADVIEGEL